MLICLAALVSGILNGLEKFTAAAASYVLFNIVSIACMLWLTPYVPTVGHALSWGISLSGAVQLGLLLVAVRRSGMALSIPRPRMTPQMRLLMRRMAPGLLGAGVTQLNLTVDVIIASLLPAGTVSVLYFADRVQQLPLGVLGTAVGTALLPLLSRQVRAGEAASALATLNRAIEYALFLTLPAALALIVCAYPIMLTLFGRGAFSAASAHAVVSVARCLCDWAAGLCYRQGADAGVFRQGRHQHAGQGRDSLRSLEPGAELRVHGPARSCRSGAGHQPCGDLQCRRVWPSSWSGGDIWCRTAFCGDVCWRCWRLRMRMAAVLYGLRQLLFQQVSHGVIQMASLAALIGAQASWPTPSPRRCSARMICGT